MQLTSRADAANAVSAPGDYPRRTAWRAGGRRLTL